MFPIAGQTAGPNGLNFLREPMGAPGVTKAKKIDFFFKNRNFLLKTPGIF